MGSSHSHASSASASSAVPWRDDSEAQRQQSAEAFNRFLRSARTELETRLKTPDAAAVHVLMGNEAADADSIVSSMVYAFVKRQQNSETLHVPVLPIPRAELPLRCDVMALFQELRIDATALFFVDEFPWGSEAQIRVTLLDHNALNNKRIPQTSSMQVVEIVDHHSDLGQHLDAEQREVAFADGQALVASTCTLVAERLAPRSDSTHALLATMLLGVIALDSINFDPSAKKVTPRDVTAAEKLEETAFAKKEALFMWLQSEKFNMKHWASFSLANCLQVDYKEFTFATATNDMKKVGISAVLIDMAAFVRKAADAAALRDELAAYSRQNELAFLVVMAMFMTPDGGRHRQLLFFQGDGGEAQHCAAFFQWEGSLQLEPLELPETHREPHVSAFEQLNPGASRKQVAPLVQRALANADSEPAVKL
ncbi:hypothetical protein BBJ28_00013149 [Nothophytophthora sp. Chile5]|nr:hypothetical protein BBJ28_00013149 [Nothophytophthora sp. Chile5]